MKQNFFSLKLFFLSPIKFVFFELLVYFLNYLLKVFLMTFLILFFTALSYRRSSDVSDISKVDDDELDSFVHSKRIISLMLFVAFVGMAAYSFGTWSLAVIDGKGGVDREIFFSDFFIYSPTIRSFMNRVTDIPSPFSDFGSIA